MAEVLNWKRFPWFAEPTFAVYRMGRFIVVELGGAHQVITTSARVGGLTRSVRHLVNHQSCEATAHDGRYTRIAIQGVDAYHDSVCKELGLNPDRTSVMGTAANMIYAAHETDEFSQLRVDALVTAGVEGNATCAGDPAGWIETPSGWNQSPKVAGTINTLVLINQPLTPDALVGALLTITEGKSASLRQLGISSRYSEEFATGTGTDQVSVAAPLSDAQHTYCSTSSHTKFGELLGHTVRLATTTALRWQNGLEPSLTRSLFHALRRFGFSEKVFFDAMAARLSKKPLQLLKKNKEAVLYEPQVAAAACALTTVWDRIRFGVLPVSAARDVLRQQAATLAASLSARPESWYQFLQELEVDQDRPLELVYDALALGWRAKWESKH